MKNYLTSVSFSLLFLGIAQSQVRPTFENLHLQDCSTGYLWNQVPILNDFPNGTEYVFLNYIAATQILSNIREADIDTSSILVPQFDVIKSEMNDLKVTEHVIPISIVEMKMDCISEAAMDNEWVFVSNSTLEQDENANVFDVDTVVMLYIDIETCVAHDLQFMLATEHYYHNFEGLPGLIEIDFDDGSGFQTISLDTPVLVQYSTMNSDREIRLRITRNGSLKKSGYRMGSSNCVLDYDEPSTSVPWTTNVPTEPWLTDPMERACSPFRHLPWLAAKK